MKKIPQLFALLVVASFANNVSAEAKVDAKASLHPFKQVHLYNSTDLYMSSTVNYLACRPDNAMMDPFSQWEATSRRGYCLVNYIETQGSRDGQHYDVEVAPYQSSGTKYSQFALILDGGNYKTIRYNENQYSSHLAKNKQIN